MIWPEIPADIYELGLIYKVDIADDRTVVVETGTDEITGRGAGVDERQAQPELAGQEVEGGEGHVGGHLSGSRAQGDHGA